MYIVNDPYNYVETGTNNTNTARNPVYIQQQYNAWFRRCFDLAHRYLIPGTR